MKLNNELPSVYQKIIHLSRYSRYQEELKRRETYEETVDRLMQYLYKKTENTPNVWDGSTFQDLRQAILNLEVMPSMRLLMSAGVACDRDNVAAYNCSYREMNGSGEKLHVLTDEMREAGLDEPVTICISSPICFDEVMYILLCGYTVASYK